MIYDPENVNVFVDNIALTGFAEDSFIQAEHMEDAFTEYIGARGEVSYAENASKAGEITVTLASTSPSIPFLNELAQRKGENAIIPVSIIDLNSNKETVSGDRARVRKPATYEAGKEISEREFVIFVENMEFR